MKKHIVVIEDDPELLLILETVLNEGGYRVTTLRQMDSVEGLIDLKADAFVIDEKLPVVNGHIICIILKSKPETRHLPVILISADEKLEHMASLCEANAFLSKPFNDYRDIQRLLNETMGA